MRLTLTITMAIFALTSTNAYAGSIQIKKAKRKATEVVEAQLAKVKKECGATFTAPIDWTNIDKASEESLKKARRTRVNVIGVHGKLLKTALTWVHKLCKDADYKAELKKLKTIALLAPKDISMTKATVKLAGKKLKLTIPFVNNDTSFFKKLKGAF